MNVKNFFAFSLIELLISLIIISLITSAFSPIMLKRLKHANISVSAQESLKTNCYHIDKEGFCKLCIKEECIACKRSCETGYFPEPLSCKCKECLSGCKTCTDNYSCASCIAGFGLKGKICEKCPLGSYSEFGECKKCPNGFINNERTSCTSCSSKYGQYCSTCSAEECLGCISDEYKISEDKKSCEAVDPCPKYDAILIENSDKSIRFCMKKRNAGDALGPSILGINGNSRCWQGRNADACGVNSSTNIVFNYSGCHRTLCNFYAAQQICSSIGWSVPTYEQLNVLKNIINSEKKENALKNIQKYNPNGLELCSFDSFATAPRCDSNRGQCANSDILNWCDPSDIYGITPGGSAVTFRYQSDTFIMLTDNEDKNNASSVRCVLSIN